MTEPENKTRTVGIVQVKGGAGRSTVATTIAGELAKHGSVALIDCDQPQGTAASWAALRQGMPEKSPVTAYKAASHRELVNVANRVTGSVDWIVMDGPPRIAEMTRAILALSDLAIVPVGASPAEVWATSDVLPLIEEAQTLRPIQARMLWTRFRPYTRLAQELEGQASRELGLKAMRAHLGFRVAYAEALGQGLTSAEVGDAVARNETEALLSEINRILR
jgi:chromosome partitioning protein